MNIVVSKQDLEKALQVCSNTVGSGNVDISTHFVFRYKDSKLEVLSYSSRLFSSAIVNAAKVTNTEEHTSFTIEAKRLKMWLSAVSASALEFSFNGSTTKAKSNMGSQTFRSLDPSTFPYWDDVAGEATETSKISADALKDAFSHVRRFISTEDTQRPAFCVTEARDGVLLAASTGLFSAVQVSDLKEDNKMRVNGKNVNSLVSFLSLFDDNDISICEHKNFILYKALDGSLFGESRDNHSFPSVKISLDDSTDHKWFLNIDELKNAMVFLRSGAPHEDHKITFKHENSNTVKVGMSVAGPDGGNTFIDLSTVSQESDDDVEDITEFTLNYKHLEMILSTLKDDRVKLGVSKKNTGGLVRLDNTIDGNRYVSMLTWLK